MSDILNEGKLGEDDVLVVFFVAERRCQGLLRTRAGQCNVRSENDSGYYLAEVAVSGPA